MLILQFRCQFDDALITPAGQILILLVLVPYFNIGILKKNWFRNLDFRTANSSTAFGN